MRDAVARVDVVEDSLLAGRLRTTRTELGSMRRVLVWLQRLLAPEPEIAARVNEETGRSLFVLTIVTVLALPINIIAGIVLTFTAGAGAFVIRMRNKG